MRLTKEYQSKSNAAAKPHVATFDTDARAAVSCTCRGFRSPAKCWHIVDIAESFDRGELGAAPKAAVVVKFPTVMARVEPMLASAMTKGATLTPYLNANWIAEEKFDGDRQLTTIVGGVVIESRSRAGNTRDLPVAVKAVLAHLPDGTYDLEDMATRKTLGGDRDGRRVVLFDIVELMGQRVTEAPMKDCREMLVLAFAHITKVDPDQTVVALSEQFPVTEALIQTLLDKGEGAILKRVASRYISGGRTADWVKVKHLGAVTVTIRGFEAGDTGIANGRTVVVDEAGREFTVKTGAGKKDVYQSVSRNPEGFIGQRLVIAYIEKLESGAYRHPSWDHMAGAKE